MDLHDPFLHISCHTHAVDTVIVEYKNFFLLVNVFLSIMTSAINILIMQFRWQTSFPKVFEIVAYHVTPYFLFWGICVPCPEKTFFS